MAGFFLNKIVMRKIVIILSALAIIVASCWQTAKGQTLTITERHSIQSKCEAKRAAILDFLIKHAVFRDVDLSAQKAADKVNTFLRKVFEKQYSDDQIPDLIAQALALLYDNSIGEFEDSPDVRRMTIRRSMCFIALAFLADEWRYPTFLADARNTLNNIEPFANSNMLLIVNMIELYRVLYCEFVSERDIEFSKRQIESLVSRYQNDLESREQYTFSATLVAEYRQILSNLLSLWQ